MINAWTFTYVCQLQKGALSTTFRKKNTQKIREVEPSGHGFQKKLEIVSQEVGFCESLFFRGEKYLGRDGYKTV